MTVPRPYTLVAELTYRCPLRCTYCSNPLSFAQHSSELDTAAWKRVLVDAEELGIVQFNLSGGEPLLRDDLGELVAQARALDLYTNLITSGIPLARERLVGLRAAGLDNLQLSIQDVSAEASDRIAGRKSFERKLEVAAWVKELGIPLTLNIVLHRDNLDRVAEAIALAEKLGADRLELANAQYLGWALVNRAALLPTREQLDHAREIALDARDRLKGRMEVLFVIPDYYSEYPPACMDGWARRFVLVTPDGLVLPCHAAHALPLSFDNVGERSLKEIWASSSALNAFRGEDWMSEPCKSCERRNIDFGGCRCQAFLLTGDLKATDPVCTLAPQHSMVERARDATSVVSPGQLVYRTERNSRALATDKLGR